MCIYIFQYTILQGLWWLIALAILSSAHYGTYNQTHDYVCLISYLHFTASCEVELEPKSCSCVYTCSTVNTSLIWQSDDGIEEALYCGKHNDYCSDQTPITHGCYIFELEKNIKLLSDSLYNITSTLTINPNCSSEHINNMTMKCWTQKDLDEEEVLVCLPGKKLYKNTSPYNNYFHTHDLDVFGCTVSE